jgi:hypothetical protein
MACAPWPVCFDAVQLLTVLYMSMDLVEDLPLPHTNLRTDELEMAPAGLGAQPGPRVCILGGGFGGLYTAVRLDQLIWPREARPQVTSTSACVLAVPAWRHASRSK